MEPKLSSVTYESTWVTGIDLKNSAWENTRTHYGILVTIPGSLMVNGTLYPVDRNFAPTSANKIMRYQLMNNQFIVLKVVPKRAGREEKSLDVFHRNFIKVNDAECKKYIVQYLGSARVSFDNLTEEAVFLFEHIPSGDLNDHIFDKKTMNTYPIQRKVIAQIFNSVQCLHSKGIIHRDIKPENFMVTEDLNIKLTDFDSLCDLSKSEVCDGKSGTRGYQRKDPRERFNMNDDWFAVGLTIFALLTGQLIPPEFIYPSVPTRESVQILLTNTIGAMSPFFEMLYALLCLACRAEAPNTGAELKGRIERLPTPATITYLEEMDRMFESGKEEVVEESSDEESFPPPPRKP